MIGASTQNKALGYTTLRMILGIGELFSLWGLHHTGSWASGFGALRSGVSTHLRA